jgi:hypothetical protein
VVVVVVQVEYTTLLQNLLDQNERQARKIPVLLVDDDDDSGDAMVSKSMMATTMIPLPGAIQIRGVGGGGPRGVFFLEEEEDMEHGGEKKAKFLVCLQLHQPQQQ